MSAALRIRPEIIAPSFSTFNLRQPGNNAPALIATTAIDAALKINISTPKISPNTHAKLLPKYRKLYMSQFNNIHRKRILKAILSLCILTYCSYSYAMHPMSQQACIDIWRHDSRSFYMKKPDAMKNILFAMIFGPLKLPGYESDERKLEAAVRISLSIHDYYDDGEHTMIDAVIDAASELHSRYAPISECLKSGRGQVECEKLAVRGGVIPPLKDFLSSVREHEKHAEVICRDDQ